MQGSRGARVVGANIHSEEQNVALIRSSFDGTAEMRFGNTRGEMAQAAWEPYTSERIWYLPGFNYKTQQVVHAQYRRPGQSVTEIALPVYVGGGDEQVPDGSAFPHIQVADARASTDIVAHRFDVWNERWTSYQDAYGRGNVFFPMSHQRSGGVDGGGFVWTDDSRWLIDAPEKPHSILIAVNYWRWLFPPEWRARTGAGDNVNLADATLEVALRGRGLELGTAHVTFWIVCDGARWHIAQPLMPGNGEWATIRVSLSTAADWQLSWSRGQRDAALCLDHVESYGLAFRGFQPGQIPRGVLDMDDFRLSRPRP